MKLFKILFPCRFGEKECKDSVFGCKCGKTGKIEIPEAPKPVSVEDQAAANIRAQTENIPRAAQLQYDVLNNPDYGLQATTKLQEDVRKALFPEETKVREQLVSNTFDQLLSPKGITSDQQIAQDAIRERAITALQEALRTRANLGGNLYGGRSQASEASDVGNLINTFAVQDIDRDERSRLNSQNLGISILQALYPQSSIQNPQFINPVASADTQFSGAINENAAFAQNDLERALAQFQSEQSQFSNLMNKNFAESYASSAGSSLGKTTTGGRSIKAGPFEIGGS